MSKLKYTEDDDYQSHPCCENCDQPMAVDRSCSRCGRRICKKCARQHKRGNNGDPEDLWVPCVKKPNKD